MELDKADWAKAETIARELAMDVDRNELGKIVAYAHRNRKAQDIMALVESLPQSGYVRSKRTASYLQRIADVLRRQLSGMDGERALLVLTWAFRLLTTYQTEHGTRTAVGRPDRKSHR